MRILTPLQALNAVVAIALLAACSGGSTIAPKLASPQSIAYSRTGLAPSILGPMGVLEIAPRTGHHIRSFDSCPATGPIKYVADNNNSVIYIYSGKFNGQAPCGQIASSSLNEPQSIHVRPGTHDFYVANGAAGNILVFHRGQTTPYNTYVDPSNQFTSDVAIAKDGTVIAVNSASQNRQEYGSLSTWTEGPNGGTFIGNFPMTNNNIGEWMTLRKNGTVYFDAGQAGGGTLWFVSCPAGACGPQRQVAGVSFKIPGGMVFDESGDLLVSDWGTGTVNRFELPNPVPKYIPVGGEPTGLAINVADHHFFVADLANHDAAEYLYPGVSLVGVVPCCTEGPLGVAVDP